MRRREGGELLDVREGYLVDLLKDEFDYVMGGGFGRKCFKWDLRILD